MVFLPADFYARKTDTVASELLGKLLVRNEGRCKLVGKIVETEAYFGFDDPASHASRGITPRSRIMYEAPGHAYIYLNYGVHWLLNFVTETSGHPGAVLIRAIEPLKGIEKMSARRHVVSPYDLTNGPGKLTQALGIDKSLNGHDLTKRPLRVAQGNDHSMDVVCAPRIGISVAQDRLLRYYVRDNLFVSKHY